MKRTPDKYDKGCKYHWNSVLIYKETIQTLCLVLKVVVHCEVNANELGFSDLSPKISFYKRV